MRLYKHTKKLPRGIQYLNAWEELKVKEKITLTLHKSQHHAVLNGIQKAKCYQQTVRYRLNLPRFGMMTSRCEEHPEHEGFILLHLALSYNGESL